MTAKLAIAICCLLVAVQARPPRSGAPTCAPSCSGRSIWTGYESGKTYKYEFQHDVQVSSDLSRGQSSRMRLIGVASVEVHADCEMLLKVNVQQTHATDSEDSESLNARETPSQVLEALRQPLRFAYQDGKVTHLCPSAGETRVSLNVKRGLLSQLHMSAGRGASRTVKERDILGECPTEYTAEGRDTLVKTKNLAACQLKYKIYPPTNIKSLDQDKVIEKVTQGSLKCRIQLHASKNLVQETVCEESHVNPIEDDTKPLSERVLVKTKLTLKEEVAGLESSLTEIQERKDLGHGHRTVKECRSDRYWQGDAAFQIGSECGERKLPESGKESRHHKDAAQNLLSAICTTVKSAKFDRSTAQKFSDLVKYLRGVTSFDDINGLYSWATTSCECKDDEFFKLTLQTAMAAAGTKAMTKLAISQFQANPSTKMPWLADVLWKTKNPTSEMLEPIMGYFMSKSWTESEVQQQSSLWYGLSDLTYRICLEDTECDSDPKVKAVIDFFSDKLQKACREPTPLAESDSITADRVAIAAAGNLGRVRGGVSYVINCALNKQVPAPHRLALVSALNRFSQWNLQDIMGLTDLVLGDRRLSSEMRITAYQVLAKFNFSPSQPLTRQITYILENAEENEQVQFYIFTHLKNAKKQKKLARQMIQSPRLVAKMARLSRTRYSSNMAATFSSKQLGRGVQLDADLVFSNASVVPRRINFNLSIADKMLGRSQNLLDFSLHLNSMEEILLSAYKAFSSSFQNSRTRREVDWTVSEDQKKMQPPQEQPRLEFLVRQDGAVCSQKGVAPFLLKSLPSAARTAGRFKSQVKDMLISQLSGLKNPLKKVGTPTEETLSIPTISGLPILIKKESNFLVNTDIQAPEVSRSSGFKVNWIVRPKATVQMKRTLAVDVVFQRAGIQTKTNLLSSTGVKLIVEGKLSDKTDLGLSFKLESLQKQEVADAKTEVFFFQQDTQTTRKTPLVVDDSADIQQKTFNYQPAKAAFGHQMQISGRFLSKKGIARSLMMAPSTCSIIVEKLPDFSAYEASVKLVNKDDEKTFEVVMGDRNSPEVNGVPKYLWKLLAQYKKAAGMSLKFDLLNRMYPVQLHLDIKQKREDMEVATKFRFLSVSGLGEGSAVYSDEDRTMTFTTTMRVKYGATMAPVEYRCRLSHKLTNEYYMMMPVTTTNLTLTFPDSSAFEAKYSFGSGENTESTGLRWSKWQTSVGLRNGDKLTNLFMSRILTSAQGYIGDNNRVIFTMQYDTQIGDGEDALLTHVLHGRHITNPFTDDRVHSTARLRHILKVSSEYLPGSADINLEMNSRPASGALRQHTMALKCLAYNRDSSTKEYNFKDIKLLLHKRFFRNTPVDDIKVFELTFKCPQMNSYKLGVKVMHTYLWTVIPALASFEVGVSPASNPAQKSELQLYNEMTSKLVQKFKVVVSGDVKIDFQHSIERVRDNAVHKLFLKAFNYIQGMRMTNKLGALEDGFKLETKLEESERVIISATHKMQKKDAGTDVEHKLTTEVTTAAAQYSHVMQLDIDKNTMDKLNSLPGRSTRKLYWLLDLIDSMKFKETHRFTATNPSRQLFIEHSVNFQAARGDIFVFKVQKGESSTAFDMRLTKEKTNADGKQIDSLNLRVSAPEEIFNHKISQELTSSKVVFKMESKDAYNWHDIEVKHEAGLALYDQVKMSAKGQVLSLPIGLSLELENKDDSTEKKYKISAEGSILSSDKYAMEFILEKSRENPQKLVIDLATPLEALKKISLAMAGRPETNGMSWTSTLKLNTFGKEYELSEASTYSYVNSGSNAREFSMDTTTEVKGLESVIPSDKMQHKVVIKMLEDGEFDGEYFLKKQDQSDKIIQQVIKYKNWPLNLEVMLKMKAADNKESKVGFRTTVEGNRLSTGVDFFDQSASMTAQINTEPVVDRPSLSKKTLVVDASTNFFSADSSALSVKATTSTIWPLNADQIEGIFELELPLQKVQKVKVELMHKPNDAKELIRVSANIEGDTHKLVEAKSEFKRAESTTEALLYVDMRQVMDGFDGFQANAKISAQPRLLTFGLLSIDKSSTYASIQAFESTSAKEVEGISHGAVDAAFLFKAPIIGINFFVAKNPTGGKSNWKASLIQSGSKIMELSVIYNPSSFESGEFQLLDKKMRIEMLNPQEVQIVLPGDSTPTYRFKLTRAFTHWKAFNVKLECEGQGFDGLYQLKVENNEMEFKYGKKESLNTLKTKLQLKLPTIELIISHEVAGEELEKIVAPGITLPINTPFKLQVNAQPISSYVLVEVPILGLQKFTYMDEVKAGLIKVESKLQRMGQTEEEAWKMLIELRDGRLFIQSRLADVYEVNFNWPQMLFKVNNVIEISGENLALQPKLGIKLPMLSSQPIELELSVERDSKQEAKLTVKYGDKEWQGVVSLNKASCCSPFEFDLEAAVTCSGSGINGIRSLSVQLQSEMKQLNSSQKQAKAKFITKVNSEDWHTFDVAVSGESLAQPSEVTVTSFGFVAGRLKVKLDADSKELQFGVDKVGSIRRKYDLLLQVSQPEIRSIIKDFKISLETPRRHFIVSKQLAYASPVKTVTVELFINKRMQHGLACKYETNDSGAQQKLELQLPTRKIELRADKAGNALTSTFAWDAAKDASKAVRVTVRIADETSGTSKIYIECTAPFLVAPEKFELVKEYTRNEMERLNRIAFKLNRLTVGNTFSLTSDVTFSDTAERDRVQVRLSSSGTSEEHKAEILLKVRVSKPDTEVKGQLVVSVPSKPIRRSLYVVYRPKEELTLACDLGFYASLTHFNHVTKRSAALTFSGLDKVAGRLSLSLDKQEKKVKVTLAKGQGHFDSVAERITFIEEAKVIQGQAGLSDSGRRLFGEFAFGQPIAFDAEGSPSGSGFFRAGLKLLTSNRMNYFVKWNTGSLSFTDFLSQITLKTATSFKVTLTKCLGRTFEAVVAAKDTMKTVMGQSQNFNSMMLEEIQGFFGTDIDGLKIFIDRLMRDNEFFLGDISGFVQTVTSAAQKLLQQVFMLAYGVCSVISRLGYGYIYAPVEQFITNLCWKVTDMLTDAYDCVKDLCSNIDLQTVKFAVKEAFRFVQLTASRIADSTAYETLVWLIQDVFGGLIYEVQNFSSSSQQMIELLFGKDGKTLAPASIQVVKTLMSINTIPTVISFGNYLAEGQYKMALNRILEAADHQQIQFILNPSNGVINGSLSTPMAMPTLNPTYWQSDIMSLTKAGLKKSLQLLSTVGGSWIAGDDQTNTMIRLLSIPHTTTILQGDRSITTFDGVTIDHSKACNYLLAHEFRGSKFSVIQTYKKQHGETVRSQLLVSLGSLKVSISRYGIVKINGRRQTLPEADFMTGDGKSVVYDYDDDTLVAKFNGEVKNMLVVRCNRNEDSCVLKVHPLYIGKVIGAAGSMDGRISNDIYGDAQQHMRLWTAGECTETGDVEAYTEEQEFAEDRMEPGQCQYWFSRFGSPLNRCFGLVPHQPYIARCQRPQNEGRACQIAKDYAMECRYQGAQMDDIDC